MRECPSLPCAGTQPHTPMISECKEIIQKWGLPDIIKGQWKTRINEKVKIKNGQLLLRMMKDDYSKLQNIKNEVKKYLSDMSIFNARNNFSIRAPMLKCETNFMNEPH